METNCSQAYRANPWLESLIRLYRQNPRNLQFNDLFFSGKNAFRYKKEIDSKATPQFGLVAEDVERVNPDLVVRDDQASPTRFATTQ